MPLIEVNHDPDNYQLIAVDHDPFSGNPMDEPTTAMTQGQSVPMGKVVGGLADQLGRFIGGAATLPHDVAAGAVDPLSDEGIRRAADLAGMVTGGSFAAPLERNALGAGKAAAPAIREATAPLFDYSRLREVPDVPQFDLERYTPPRGVPERTEALASPENVARVNDVVQRGAEMGGLEWYNTDPLRQRFIEELGAEKGDAAYRKYIDLVAATSPRSNVGTNARNASYYYTLSESGQPLPQRVRVGNNWTIAEPLPKPYGHVAQGLHVQNAENVLQNGGWPVLQNPKPASFSQNLQGNQRPITADTHNVRLWGLTDSKGNPVDMPAKTEYAFLERLQQEQAAKLGMTPAQYQASAWVGGGEETGLRSTADPFLKVFEDRVAKTADAAGLTKEQVLRQFIRGQMPLLSGAGIVGTAAAGMPGGSDASDTAY